MNDIYWQIENSGFYALEEAQEGYIYVGHTEHQRLVDASAATGARIVLNKTEDKLVLVEPQPDAE